MSVISKGVFVSLRYLNLKEPTMNAIYSTPSCYLKAVNDVNLSWDTKQDDFFPYATDDNSYWTGYFTSRPTLKYFERLGNNFLQVNFTIQIIVIYTFANLFIPITRTLFLSFLRDNLHCFKAYSQAPSTST